MLLPPSLRIPLVPAELSTPEMIQAKPLVFVPFASPKTKNRAAG